MLIKEVLSYSANRTNLRSSVGGLYDLFGHKTDRQQCSAYLKRKHRGRAGGNLFHNTQMPIRIELEWVCGDVHSA